MTKTARIAVAISWIVCLTCIFVLALDHRVENGQVTDSRYQLSRFYDGQKYGAELVRVLEDGTAVASLKLNDEIINNLVVAKDNYQIVYLPENSNESAYAEIIRTEYHFALTKGIAGVADYVIFHVPDVDFAVYYQNASSDIAKGASRHPFSC